MARIVIDLIKRWWRGFLEKRALGFNREQLGALYVELVGRDDEDWCSIERGGSVVKVKNTAFTLGNDSLSIVGDYYTGEFLKLYRHDGDDWVEVLDSRWWMLAKRGSWESVVLKMLERA